MHAQGTVKITFVWSTSFGRPFESDHSLLAKFSWINDFPLTKYEAVRKNLMRRGSLSSELRDNIPAHLLSPKNLLVDALPKDGLFVCPECIKGLYHTDLPQQLGLEACPIHGVPFQRTCVECGQPISFKRPSFTESVFRCTECGIGLGPDGKDFIKSIQILTDTEIVSAFCPYFVDLASASHRCSGEWHVQKSAARHIYFYLTGFKDTHTPHLQEITTPICNEYMLPARLDFIEWELKNVVEHERRQLLEMAEKYHLQSGTVRDPTVSFAEDWITVWRGGNPVSGALYLLEELIAYMARDVAVFPPMYLYRDSLDIPKQYHRQLRQIIACSSLCKIFKQLLYAQEIADYLPHLMRRRWRDDVSTAVWRASDRGNFSIDTVSLDWIKLRTPLTSWLADFQMQPAVEALLLRVFRFEPETVFRQIREVT